MSSEQIQELKKKLGCVEDESAPLPEAKGDVIGYPDVATSRKALLARKDAQSHTEGGWLIVEIPSELTLWSFAPESDPAYPAAVKRVITQDSGNSSYITMNVLCEASKEACDNLVREFQKLNDNMKESLSHH
jgi:hypothetical protein